jgi:hypothetical protein
MLELSDLELIATMLARIDTVSESSRESHKSQWQKVLEIRCELLMSRACLKSASTQVDAVQLPETFASPESVHLLV